MKEDTVGRALRKGKALKRVVIRGPRLSVGKPRGTLGECKASPSAAEFHKSWAGSTWWDIGVETERYLFEACQEFFGYGYAWIETVSSEMREQVWAIREGLA